MNSRIAAIIPCYNSSETLPALIEALKAQTLPDFVALFVDDGSSDDSAAIIRDVAKVDSRFMLLSGMHNGPGAARNIGLEKVEELGVDFVTFVDSDDLPTATLFEEAASALIGKNADIVHYQWSETPQGVAHKSSVAGPGIHVWNKTYRAEAIRGVRFAAAHYAEDLAFYIETEARSPRRIQIDKPLYIHIKRDGSLWESRDPTAFGQSIKTVITKLVPLLRASNNATVKTLWSRYYLVKLVSAWQRSLRRNLREVRAKAIAEFIAFCDNLINEGFLNPFKVDIRCFRKCVRIRVGLVGLRFKISVSRQNEKFEVVRLKRNYNRKLNRLRAARDGHVVRVLFLVADVSKWKCQSVYDAMRASNRFDPYLFIDVPTDELKLSAEKRSILYAKRLEYFRARGVKCIDGYDVQKGVQISLKEAKPDIVFYQQPWQMTKDRAVRQVSNYALTCYVPYYVQDYGCLDTNCRLELHRQVFAYFLLSQSWVDCFLEDLASCPRASTLVATGHPMLDGIECHNNPSTHIKTIIYAPHWTYAVPNAKYLVPTGTFDWNGREILAYARQHPEFRWVFKPHPLLRNYLVSSRFMTNTEAEDYYKEWASLGVVCLDGDYLKWFMAASVMITDCGSFLAEFSATLKPLIQLVPQTEQIPCPPHRRLFESFYKAHTVEEFKSFAKRIIEDDEDPMKSERVAAVYASGLRGSAAAKNILGWIEERIDGGICR